MTDPTNDNAKLPHYAVLTKPSQEAFAKEQLEREGLIVYLPRCLEPGKDGEPTERPMFPRYLFVQEPSADLWRVDRTPGVVKLLRWGDHRPMKVREKIIDGLKEREAVDGIINVMPEPECLKYESDQPLRPTEGAFAGIVGKFKGLTPKGRVKLFLAILGGQELEYEPSQVECA